MKLNYCKADPYISDISSCSPCTHLIGNLPISKPIRSMSFLYMTSLSKENNKKPLNFNYDISETSCVNFLYIYRIQ